ncbi:MAG: hypothetical protein KKH04_05930 [Proteobacteria bacterium]|nr:hypothetical protein [Pseudomonadota bacterium]
MSFFGRTSGNDEDQERQQRTFYSGGSQETGRPFWPDATREKVIEILADEIEVIKKEGDSRVFYRTNALEFITKEGAAACALDYSLKQNIERLFDQEIVTKGRAQSTIELREAIAGIEVRLSSKFAEVLKRDGAWLENLITLEETAQSREHVKVERQDLNARLLEVFSDPLWACLLLKSMPKILDAAIQALPAGKDIQDVLQEHEESVARSRKSRGEKIEKLRQFLKK